MIIFCFLFAQALGDYLGREIKFDWFDCQTKRQASLVGCGENPSELVTCMEIPDTGLCFDINEHKADQASFAVAFYTKG